MSFTVSNDGLTASWTASTAAWQLAVNDENIVRIAWSRAGGAHHPAVKIQTAFAPSPLTSAARTNSTDGQAGPVRVERGRLFWRDIELTIALLSESHDYAPHPRVGSKRVDKIPRRGAQIVIRDAASRCYFGLGERIGALDKRGELWENWNTDVGKISPRTDPLYQAHPFVLMLDGEACGLFVNDARRSTFDLAATDPENCRLSFEDADDLELYLIPGPTPAEVLARFSALVGRAPLPPLWAFGYHHCRWSFLDEDEARAVAAGFHQRNIPLSALWLDIDYMAQYKVFTFSKAAYPDPKALIDSLRAQGTRTVVIVDPAVKVEKRYRVYEELVRMNGFIKDASGRPLEGEVWPKPVLWPDFSSEDVRQWWGMLHAFYLDLGIAGIWNDMNEPAAFGLPRKTLPADAIQHSGSHGALHNLYGLQMAQATFEGLKALRPERRPFILTRSGFTGIQRYAAVWLGDNRSCFEDLAASLPMLCTLSLSGVPYVGADIGGFYSDCSGELLARWLWLGSCYPFMRCHSATGTGRQEPWIFGQEVEAAAKKAIAFRYRLLPYVYTLAEEASQTGMPMLRPLFFEHPAERETYHIDDQALLGSALMVAPVVRPHRQERTVYIPPGRWFCFWTGAAVDGPCRITVRAPLDTLPLFQRAGTAIPLAAGDPQAESADWSSIEWSVAPDSVVAGTLYSDAGDGFVPGHRTTLDGRSNRATLPHHSAEILLTLNGAAAAATHSARLVGETVHCGATIPFVAGRALLPGEKSSQK